MIRQRIYKKVISLGRRYIEEADGDIEIAMERASEACELAGRMVNADPETLRHYRKLLFLAMAVAKKEREKAEADRAN